jgi:xylulokinase
VRELGQPITTIYLIGGGAKSPLWRQVICDVLGMPLTKPMVEDAAFGAAMIAGIGVGVFPDWESAVQTCARVEEVLQPNPETLDLYDDYFETYRAVTQDLAIHSHKLAHLARRNST